MKYLQNIGRNAKRAFESLKRVEHKKIQEVLNEYNNLLRINKKKIIRENKKDIIKCKRKGGFNKSTYYLPNTHTTQSVVLSWNFTILCGGSSDLS